MFTKLLAMWNGRHKQGTTWAGLALAAVAAVGLPTEEAQIAAAIIAHIGVPIDYAEIAQRVLTGLVGAVLVFLDGKKFRKPDDSKVNLPVSAAIACAALLFLTACGAVGANKQQYAGITHWQVTGNQTAEGTWQVTDVRYTNGKEEDSSEIAISLNGGDTILNFSGAGIKAFDGQALRAEVDRVVMEQIGQAAPGLSKAIIDALKP